jgi:hypothetical protein
MSSALRADRVLVLDGIRPQFGEHQALLASCPLYQDLVGQWHGASLASSKGFVDVVADLPADASGLNQHRSAKGWSTTQRAHAQPGAVLGAAAGDAASSG